MGLDGPRPATKPTRWLTNSPCLVDKLSLRCDGAHSHQEILEGRPQAAQVYPPKLCRAFFNGFARQLKVDAEANQTREPALGVPVFNLEILAADPEDPQEDRSPDWSSWTAIDVHGGELPAKLVHEARCREVQYKKKRQV